MKVLCVGMLVCDTIIRTVPKNILSIDATSIEKPVMACGGDALNVCNGLARLGCDSSILGRVGKDQQAEFLYKTAQSFGSHTDKIIADDEYSTAVTYALVDETGERHFLGNAEINSRLSADDVKDEDIIEADIVYFGSAMTFKKMDEGGIADIFKRAKSFGKTTIMDASVDPARKDEDWMKVLGEAFKYCDIFFPSVEEAMTITHKDNTEDMKEIFKDSGIKILGVKLGEKGSYFTDFKRDVYTPAYKVENIVDTTGAGDSFMAGLICGLTHGFDIDTCVKLGTAVGSKSIQAAGASTGVPTFDVAMSIVNDK